MAQVKKLRGGNTVKHRNDLKFQVDLAYQNADPLTQLKMRNVALSAQSYAENKLNSNRDIRDLEIGIYKRQLDIAAGGLGYDPTNANPNNVADRIVRDTLGNATSASTTTTTTTASSPGAATGLYSFNYNAGYSGDYVQDGDPLTTRGLAFVEMLLTNLKAAQDAKNNGKKVTRIPKEVLNDIDSWVNSLEGMLQNSLMWQSPETANSAVLQLKKLATKLGVPGDEFKSYFKEWYDETGPYKKKSDLYNNGYREISKDTLTKVNGTLSNRLDQLLKDWHIVVDKGGEKFVYDKDWNLVTNQTIIVDNPGDAAAGYAVLVGPNGEFEIGDSKNYSDINNKWNELVQRQLKKVSEARKKLNELTYDPLYGYSDDPTLDKIGEDLGFLQKFHFYDMSQLFSGDQVVIAYKPGNVPIKTDAYGNIADNQGVIYTVLSADGKSLHKYNSPLELALGENIQYNQYGEDEEEGLAKYNLVKVDGESTLTGDTDLLGRGWMAYLEGAASTLAGAGGGYAGMKLGLKLGLKGGWIGSIVGAVLGGGLGWGASVLAEKGFARKMQDLEDDPQLTFDLLLEALTSPNRNSHSAANMLDPGGEHGNSNLEIISELGGVNNVLYYLDSLLKSGLAKLSSKNATKWRAIILNYGNVSRGNVEIQSEKQGGVLKMAKGKVLDLYGNVIEEDHTSELTKGTENRLNKLRELEDKAFAAGYNNVKEYQDNMRKPVDDLSHTDLVRLGAMAADLVSIPAAWVKGHGTAVSALLGVGSTAATLYTDIADDGLQLHDVSGLAVNLAMDLAGAIGFSNAKISKIVKTAIKYSPYILALWDGVANGEQYAQAFKKLTSKERMTVQDWKMLARGMSMIAGINRTVTSSFKTKSIKNEASIDENIAKGKMDEVEVTVKNKTGKSTEKIKLNAEDAAKLKDIDDIDEVNAILKNYNKDGKEFESIEGKGILGIGKKKNPYKKKLEAAFKKYDSKINEDIMAGAMYENPENELYLGAQSPERSGFANSINDLGLSLKLASDVDIATGNFKVGPFGMLRLKKEDSYYRNKFITARDGESEPETPAPAPEGTPAPEPTPTAEPYSIGSEPAKKITRAEKNEIENLLFGKGVSKSKSLSKFGKKLFKGPEKIKNEENFKSAIAARYRELKEAGVAESEIKNKLIDKAELEALRDRWNSAYPDKVFKRGGSITRLNRLQSYVNYINK